MPGAMAKRTKPTPKKLGKPRSSGDWADAFLASLREEGNVREACKAADVHRTTAYDRRRDDPAFAAAWRDALDDAVDALEKEARARAKAQSDTLLIFLLKSHRPEVYREQVKLDHSVVVAVAEEIVDACDADD